MLLTGVVAGCSPAPIATGVFAGKPDWTIETPDNIISTPLASGNWIVLRTEKQVITLDGLTHKVRWAVESLGTINFNAPPIIADSLLLVPEYGNPLAAFDLVSGDLVWKNCVHSPRQKNCAEPSAAWEINGLSSDGRIVVVSRFSGGIIGYNALNGDQLWVIDSPRRGGPFFTIDSGNVYFDKHETNVRQLWGVDLKTGALRWQLDIDDVSGRMVIQDGTLYLIIGSADVTKVEALTLATYSVAWQLPFPGIQPSAGTYLTLDNNVLFVAADKVAAISIANGSVIWEANVAQRMRNPVVFGDMLLVRDDHILYAFDKRTGAQLGQLPLELTPGHYDVELNPAVYGDLVLIPVGAKQLAAYRLKMPGQ